MVIIVHKNPFNRNYIQNRNVYSILITFMCYGGYDLKRCSCGIFRRYDKAAGLRGESIRDWVADRGVGQGCAQVTSVI